MEQLLVMSGGYWVGRVDAYNVGASVELLFVYQGEEGFRGGVAVEVRSLVMVQDM
jgi:hypothetical protein